VTVIGRLRKPNADELNIIRQIAMGAKRRTAFLKTRRHSKTMQTRQNRPPRAGPNPKPGATE